MSARCTIMIRPGSGVTCPINASHRPLTRSTKNRYTKLRLFISGFVRGWVASSAGRVGGGINVSTVTSTALLEGLRDPANSLVWSDFYARYCPVLIAFARRLGLAEHDAQDAAQETLLAFATAYRAGKYKRDKGRLRTWLYGISSHKIRDIQRRGGRERVIADTSDQTGLMDRIPDAHSMSELWEAEWQRVLLKACIEEVRSQVQPSSMQVFELTVVRKWPVDKVVSEVGLSRDAVLNARGRVLSRVRDVLQRMESEW